MKKRNKKPKHKKASKSPNRQELISDIIALSEESKSGVCGRGYYRSNGAFTDSAWENEFGTFTQFQRAAGIKPTRMQQKILNKIALQEDMSDYRKYYYEQVLPWQEAYARPNKYKGRFVNFLNISDIHDEEVDHFLYSTFVDTAIRTQPDVIIFNGDVYDNYEFSSYTHDTRRTHIKKRFDFVKESIWSPIRDACPKADIYFVAGNHEFRIMKFLAGRAPEAIELMGDIMGLSLKDIFGLDDFHINLISKADLAATNSSDVNRELKKNSKIFCDNAFVASHEYYKDFGISGFSGHLHKPKLTSWANVFGRHTWAQLGGACMYNPDYSEYSDDWMKGYGRTIVDTKTKEVQQILNNMSGDFIESAGKIYFRDKEAILADIKKNKK